LARLQKLKGEHISMRKKIKISLADLILNKKIAKLVNTNEKEYRCKKAKEELIAICFDDGKTFLEIKDQDYYDYHDCDSSAKVITIFQNEEIWEQYMSDKYPEFKGMTNWMLQ
jgi:hypothetical protein